jgi:hypothetical protein
MDSGDQSAEAAPFSLPRGIDPVTKGSFEDFERLKTEVKIIYPVDPALRTYPWGREAFFRSKSSGMYPNRLLVAYSVNAASRIVRGWYLTEFDQSPYSWYRDKMKCPCESAWLATITAGKPSEPAWFYICQPHRIEIEQPNGD